MGIQINGATDTISASDGSLSVTSSESIFSGIATFSDGVNLTGPSLIEVNSSSNALRITQTGSGNVFLAEDQTNPDGSPFVITGSGSVGIGTTNPSGKLEINSGNDNLNFFLNSTDGDVNLGMADTGGSIRLLQAGGELAFRVGGAANSFGSGDVERVRINSSGNVGIGLTNPGALLSIPAGESNTPRFAIESAVDNNDFTITQYEDGNGTYTMLGQNVKLNSSGNNTILDSGHRTAGILLDARNHGAITFFTGDTNAGSENIKIDANGRIHIGGSSVPLVNLSINGTGGQGGGIQINRNTSGSPTNGQSLGSIAFKGVSSANTNAAAEAMIEAIASQDHSGTAAGTDMVFRTKLIDDGPGSAPSEALRIRDDGRVINSEGNTVSYDTYRTRFYAYDTNPLIVCEGTGSGYTEGAFLTWSATNDRGAGLYMYNENGASTAIEWYAGRPYSASDQFIIARKSGPTDPGSDTAQVANKLLLLTNGGNMTINGTLTQSGSDDKLKTNRVGLTSALEKVKTLEGFTYNWNDNAINNYGFSPDDGTLVGMSAQELQLVLPEAVKTISVNGEVEDPTSGESGESREYLTIQYERVVPLLVQAIKELSEKNVELEARLATLEGQ